MSLTTASGFSVGGDEPIDTRFVLTKAQMLTIDENVYPSDYFAICSDDKSIYIFSKDNEVDEETGKFRLFKTVYDYGAIEDKYNFKNCASVVDLYNSIGGCLINVHDISDIFPETKGVIILSYANSYMATIYSTPVYTINMWFISTTGKIYICNDNSSTVSWNNSPYYIKAINGILKSDLESSVQTSLSKADTSLQSETSLSKGTTSGSGNAVTDISVSGHNITLTKGSTFLTSHQDISGKVDKISGKGLSTNDFTTALKTKLDGIATNAEVNVQSDWNVTDTSSDAYIKNKPTIPDISGKVDKISGKGLSTNDFTTALKTKLDGIATNAEVNVQSDWNVTDTSSDAYIKNKPTIPDISGKLNLSGGTMTGALLAQKGLRIPTSAPSSPQDGDIWIG